MAKLWRVLGGAKWLPRPHLSSALLYAVVAVPGLLCSYHAMSMLEQTAGQKSDRRLLRFPAARPAGTLYSVDTSFGARMERFENGTTEERWVYLKPAQGDVRVTRGDRVWLELNGSTVGQPASLSKLNPDLLYRVSLEERSPLVSEELLLQLARLSGLRELDLRNARSLPADCDCLSGLSRLERLWLPWPEDAVARARSLRWGACAGMNAVKNGEGARCCFCVAKRFRIPLTTDYVRGIFVMTTVVIRAVEESGVAKRKKKDLGELELAVLNTVWEHPASSVREIAAIVTETRPLARTTILTVMQRLHAKGFLKRRKIGAVYRYTATGEQGQVLGDLIGQFVQKILCGSPAPFLAYLAETKDLTEGQIAQLRGIVDDLERNEEGG